MRCGREVGGNLRNWAVIKVDSLGAAAWKVKGSEFGSEDPSQAEQMVCVP